MQAHTNNAAADVPHGSVCIARACACARMAQWRQWRLCVPSSQPGLATPSSTPRPHPAAPRCIDMYRWYGLRVGLAGVTDSRRHRRRGTVARSGHWCVLVRVVGRAGMTVPRHALLRDTIADTTAATVATTRKPTKGVCAGSWHAHVYAWASCFLPLHRPASSLARLRARWWSPRSNVVYQVNFRARRTLCCGTNQQRPTHKQLIGAALAPKIVGSGSDSRRLAPTACAATNARPCRRPSRKSSDNIPQGARRGRQHNTTRSTAAAAATAVEPRRTAAGAEVVPGACDPSIPGAC